MVNLSIQITGGREVQAKLAALGKSLYELPGEMEAIGKFIKEYTQGEVFASAGGVLGARWQRDKSATVRAKQRRYPTNSQRTLVASGKMLDSFTFSASATQVIVKNEAVSDKGYKYFRAHQLGLGHVPQRIMLMVNQAQKDKIKEIINDGIRAKIKGANL